MKLLQYVEKKLNLRARTIHHSDNDLKHVHYLSQTEEEDAGTIAGLDPGFWKRGA